MEIGQYSTQCQGYADDSVTCTKALDKNYCGIYRAMELIKNE